MSSSVETLRRLRFNRRSVHLANSGLPYPIRCTPERCEQIELPGVPFGSLAGSSYDEVSFELRAGDLFAFCTDGVFEAIDALNASSAPHDSCRPSLNIGARRLSRLLMRSSRQCRSSEVIRGPTTI